MLAAYTPLPQRGIVRRVKLPPGKKLIALTFDLCEQPSEIAGYQGGIVDFLRQNRIKATFFVGGKWMLSHRDRAQQLMADGLFEVANHAWEHRNLRNLSGRALTDEVRNVQLAYEQVRDELAAKQCVGRTAACRPRSRRRGGSACSASRSAHAARRRWRKSPNRGSCRFNGTCRPAIRHSGCPPATMTQNVLASVRPGSIVLFHANGRGWSTEAALPGIVSALQAKGYEFVTVTELLAAGEPVMSDTCYDFRPGDTDRPRPPRRRRSAVGSIPLSRRTPRPAAFALRRGLGRPSLTAPRPPAR